MSILQIGLLCAPKKITGLAEDAKKELEKLLDWVNRAIALKDKDEEVQKFLIAYGTDSELAVALLNLERAKKELSEKNPNLKRLHFNVEKNIRLLNSFCLKARLKARILESAEFCKEVLLPKMASPESKASAEKLLNKFDFCLFNLDKLIGIADVAEIKKIDADRISVLKKIGALVPKAAPVQAQKPTPVQEQKENSIEFLKERIKVFVRANISAAKLRLGLPQIKEPLVVWVKVIPEGGENLKVVEAKVVSGEYQRKYNEFVKAVKAPADGLKKLLANINMIIIRLNSPHNRKYPIEMKVEVKEED